MEDLVKIECNLLTFFVLLALLTECPALEFTIQGSGDYAVKGEDYRMNCSITGNVPSAVKFMLNGLEACQVFPSSTPNVCALTSVMNERYHCECNTPSYYINITGVHTKDDGVWKCIHGQASDGISNEITVPVFSGPVNIGLDTGHFISVTEGVDKTVICSAYCVPPPCSIKWFTGTTEVSTTGGRLTLNNRHQAGDYTCQADHTVIPNKHQTTTLQVTVYYGPDNLQFDTENVITMIEGSSRTVTCTADCNPYCAINWMKGSSVLSTNVLTLMSINRTDAGSYTCRAVYIEIRNTQLTKQLMVVVNYPPTITSLISNAVNNIIEESSSVTFTCAAEGKPEPNITWSPPDGNIETGGRYDIPDASCQHTHFYTCTADNDVGSSVSRTLPLYVRCSPVLSPDSVTEVTGRVGQMVNLEVIIIAYPEPTFTWKKNASGVELTGVKTIQLSANSFKSSVELILEESSFGVYLVAAQNVICEQIFNVTVVDGDDTPQDPSTGSNSQTTWIIVGVILALILGIFLGLLAVCIYKKRFLDVAKVNSSSVHHVNEQQLDIVGNETTCNTYEHLSTGNVNENKYESPRANCLNQPRSNTAEENTDTNIYQNL